MPTPTDDATTVKLKELAEQAVEQARQQEGPKTLHEMEALALAGYARAKPLLVRDEKLSKLLDYFLVSWKTKRDELVLISVALNEMRLADPQHIPLHMARWQQIVDDMRFTEFMRCVREEDRDC